MSDVVLFVSWLGVLVGGLGLGVWLKRRGVATTYVRDLVHVGVSVWVLGWPSWSGVLAPASMTLGALAAVSLIPVLSDRSSVAASIHRSLAGGDERWTGIVLYVASFAALTPIGVSSILGGVLRVPAAAALLALAWGDGIGGLVGRRFGRTHYRVPGAKTKSVEGTFAVAIFSGAAVWFAGVWLGAPVAVSTTVIAAVIAALVEAIAPRASDNVLLPMAVFTAVGFSAWHG
ncbi:hypothetical protein L6R52_17190 [Myxococcota bacterium]|nr:hypothetical protein [Myxococcota bacterium]